jgi:hypothetical protein
LISIDAALVDKNLLGAALGKPDSWQTWQVVLKSAFALPLSESDRRTFKAVAGDRKPPAAPVKELWCVAGRQSGKSRIAALISSYIAAFQDHRKQLAPGEVGYILTLSPSLDQSQIIYRYTLAFLESSPILRQKIVDATAAESRLENNVVISTHPASYRTVRGRTLLAVVCDESAYWRSDESASPDREVYRAILPSLARTNGMLIGISSPYRRVGLLYEKHRDHHGVDGDVLVIQAATSTLNPLIDKAIIGRARADDPASAAAEWDACFRSDLSQLIPDEQIDAAVEHGRPAELPPCDGVKYHAFADPSGGRGDAFCLCIGHQQDGKFVADVIRGKKPPFNAESVVAEYTSLARAYRCNVITSDAYGAQWVSQSFRKAGIDHKTSKLNRSELYLESIPFWMRSAVSIPGNHQLVRELRLLERKTSPSGADKVDHPRGGSDDHANALAGAMYLAMREPRDIEVMQPIGTWPAKIFDLGTGVQINRDHPPLPGPEGPNAEAQIASLKAQAAEMRAEYHPPSQTTLSPEAQARLEKFKQDQKQESLYTIFCGKVFGAR